MHACRAERCNRLLVSSVRFKEEGGVRERDYSCTSAPAAKLDWQDEARAYQASFDSFVAVQRATHPPCQRLSRQRTFVRDVTLSSSIMGPVTAAHKAHNPGIHYLCRAQKIVLQIHKTARPQTHRPRKDHVRRPRAEGGRGPRDDIAQRPFGGAWALSNMMRLSHSPFSMLHFPFSMLGNLRGDALHGCPDLEPTFWPCIAHYDGRSEILPSSRRLQPDESSPGIARQVVRQDAASFALSPPRLICISSKMSQLGLGRPRLISYLLAGP